MRPATRVRQQRREAILDAATNAIATHGVVGMRVEQVAADAGVSIALLYYHFENRVGLLRAALNHAHERAPSTGRLAVRPSDAPAFEALRDALLAEFDETPSVRQFSIVWGEATANAVFQAELREDVARVGHSWAEDVADAIRAGVEDGSVSNAVDARAAACLLTVLTDGLCARWLAGVMELEEARRILDVALQDVLRPPPGR